MIGYPWSITHTLQSAEHSSVPLILKKPKKVACDGTTESEKGLFTIVFLWSDVFRKTTGVDMSVCVLILYTTVVFTVSSSTLLTCRRNKLHRHITKQNKNLLVWRTVGITRFSPLLILYLERSVLEEILNTTMISTSG